MNTYINTYSSTYVGRYTLLLTIYESYYSNVDPNSLVLETLKTNPELSGIKALGKVNLVKKKS